MPYLTSQPTPLKQMAMFIPCSSLRTRSIAWIPCNAKDLTQETFAGMIVVGESSFFAHCYAEKYADEAISKLPNFDEPLCQ